MTQPRPRRTTINLAAQRLSPVPGAFFSAIPAKRTWTEFCSHFIALRVSDLRTTTSTVRRYARVVDVIAVGDRDQGRTNQPSNHCDQPPMNFTYCTSVGGRREAIR